jgi:hypothetical protein
MLARDFGFAVGIVALIASCAQSSDDGLGTTHCADGGGCPAGQVCQNAVCVSSGNGGNGGSAGSTAQGGSAGATGGVGGSSGGLGGTGGGFGGTGGGFGGTGGGFGGTGGGFGGTGGGFGGVGGGAPGCQSSIQFLACADTWDTTTACGQCLVANCCNETSACMNDHDCSGFLECIVTFCVSDPDINTCATTYCSACGTQAAITLFNGMGTCADTSCATPCQ